MKLFLVKCRGMTSGIGSDTTHGRSYVVADDPESAYRVLRRHLDKINVGFDHERALDSVELLAETGTYPECGTPLHFAKT